VIVHLLDVEWLLSTLFDASLLNFRAAGNGGSFLFAVTREPFPSPSRGNYIASFLARTLDRPPPAGDARSPTG
jgi:hypothetical protein